MNTANQPTVPDLLNHVEEKLGAATQTLDGVVDCLRGLGYTEESDISKKPKYAIECLTRAFNTVSGLVEEILVGTGAGFDHVDFDLKTEIEGLNLFCQIAVEAFCEMEPVVPELPQLRIKVRSQIEAFQKAAMVCLFVSSRLVEGSSGSPNAEQSHIGGTSVQGPDQSPPLAAPDLTALAAHCSELFSVLYQDLEGACDDVHSLDCNILPNKDCIVQDLKRAAQSVVDAYECAVESANNLAAASTGQARVGALQKGFTALFTQATNALIRVRRSLPQSMLQLNQKLGICTEDVKSLYKGLAVVLVAAARTDPSHGHVVVQEDGGGEQTYSASHGEGEGSAAVESEDGRVVRIEENSRTLGEESLVHGSHNERTTGTGNKAHLHRQNSDVNSVIPLLENLQLTGGESAALETSKHRSQQETEHPEEEGVVQNNEDHALQQSADRVNGDGMNRESVLLAGFDSQRATELFAELRVLHTEMKEYTSKLESVSANAGVSFGAVLSGEGRDELFRKAIETTNAIDTYRKQLEHQCHDCEHVGAGSITLTQRLSAATEEVEGEDELPVANQSTVVSPMSSNSVGIGGQSMLSASTPFAHEADKSCIVSDDDVAAEEESFDLVDTIGSSARTRSSVGSIPRQFDDNSCFDRNADSETSSRGTRFALDLPDLSHIRSFGAGTWSNASHDGGIGCSTNGVDDIPSASPIEFNPTATDAGSMRAGLCNSIVPTDLSIDMNSLGVDVGARALSKDSRSHQDEDTSNIDAGRIGRIANLSDSR